MLLNLDDVESHVFSGGEVHVKLPHLYPDGVMLHANLHNSDQIMKLLMVTDALRRAECPAIQLSIPYLPYARQDRVCNPGEALSIKVFADLINSQNYEKVFVLDAHSDVGPAVLNNCEVVSNHELVINVLRDIQKRDGILASDIVIVSPDAGSNKKIKDLMKTIGNSAIRMIKCDKTRDTMTGALTGFEVYADDLEGKTCIIVDDICDGGGTFIGLATELIKKNCGPLYLTVSHGIFSKGFDQLGEYFEKIYTTRSFPGKRDEELVIELKPYLE